MKRIIYITIVLLTAKLFAQDLTKVDQKVLSYPEYNDLYELTHRISNDFDTELERVRAVYTWIANNISYSYRASEKSTSFTFSNQEEYKRKIQLRKLRTAKNTIIKKAGICHGYATLFNEMCKILKVESYYITGMAKNELKNIASKYNTNHAWNMVVINDKKYLIDATWGSGSYDVNKGFKKKLTYFYFFTDPKKLINSHYPEDYENSLLTENISKSTFLKAPLYYNRNNERLNLITPKLGKINKQNREKIKFSYKVDKEIIQVSYLLNNEFFKVNEYHYSDGILSFKIDVFETKGNQLLVYINGKAVNGFKLR